MYCERFLCSGCGNKKSRNNLGNLPGKFLGIIHPYILPIQNCNGVAESGKNFWRKKFYENRFLFGKVMT